ncbi:hypothetical protein HDU91_004321, partial [Kappamyces sp. JEL0680]
MLLKNSAACPGQNGLAISTTSVYSDTASFDSFVNAHLDSTGSYVDSFRSSYGCPEYNGKGQRFHITMFCALLTQKPGPNCQFQDQATRVPLCANTCQAAAATLSAVYQNTCVSNRTADVQDTRQKTVSFYYSFCATLTIPSNTATNPCLDGTAQPQEKSTCGIDWQSD